MRPHLIRRRKRSSARRLRGESLETRNLLAAFIVSSTEDLLDDNPGDGICQVSEGGPCTLRAAIQEANRLANVDGPDQVSLPPGIYTLAIDGIFEQQTRAGDLDITDDLVLQGSGASGTIIDGGGIDRVIDVVSGVVQLNGLTIRGGMILDSEDLLESNGGGVRNEGELTIVNSIVSGNISTVGSGIANYNGTLRIRQSTITGNGSAATSRGGGVDNFGSYYESLVDITDTTIAGNRAESGGAVSNFSEDGTARTTIASSTLSGNTAQVGAGISNRASTLYADTSVSNLIVRNSTISGNVAGSSGGGIHSLSDADSQDTVDIGASTIVGNTAEQADGGGVLAVESIGSLITIQSTIISGNQANGVGPDLAATSAVSSFSLVQHPDGHSLINGQSGNLIGIDSLLGPLEDNGGLTLTHAPLTGSPVIDQGSNLNNLSSDQRGSSFVRVVDTPDIENADDGTDIGAIEVGPSAAMDDFGDAPDAISVGGILRSYPTQLASEGARHRIQSDGPKLGLSAPDGEIDAAATSTALGDDFAGLDDEDALGSLPVTLTPGSTIDGVNVTHDGGSGGALVNAWIDFNLDGDWNDPGEQILIDSTVPPGVATTSLSSVMVPEDAVSGTSFMRLRISTQAGLSPSGAAVDGEVEDHAVTIGEASPRQADLSLTQTVNDANPGLGDDVTFTVTVRNDGPDRATNVEVTNTLPLDLSFVASTVTQGSYDDLDGIWTIGTLNPGETANLNVTATVEATDPIRHEVEITASDQIDPDSTPDNGILGEDDDATVMLGTCLQADPLHVGINRLVFSCAAPNTFSAFVRGTQTGSKLFPQYGINVDISDGEEFALGISDSTGVAVAHMTLTEDDIGETIRIQAFNIGPGFKKSNTLPLELTLNTNAANSLDVNNDRSVSAFDALLVINQLQRQSGLAGESEAGPVGGRNAPTMYFDTNADFRVTALDALLIINHLSRTNDTSLEGETTTGTAPAALPIARPEDTALNRNVQDAFWASYHDDLHRQFALGHSLASDQPTKR